MPLPQLPDDHSLTKDERGTKGDTLLYKKVGVFFAFLFMISGGLLNSARPQISWNSNVKPGIPGNFPIKLVRQRNFLDAILFAD